MILAVCELGFSFGNLIPVDLGLYGGFGLELGWSRRRAISVCMLG